MNAIVTRQNNAVAVSEEAVIDALHNSLYPGARHESVMMVLNYCRARGLDPMLKPVHIVPMWVKDAATDKGGMRDVVMPGIPLYRIQAARTGCYAGKSEPEFGPEISRELGGVQVSYPQWCRVTVTKIVDGKERHFTAKEFWTENYATARKDSEAPNAMWKKRAYGQLAKCTEAQALRMAFPEETGGEVTAEEMDGKSFAGPTIDAQPEPARPPLSGGMVEHQRTSAMDRLRARVAACTTRQDVAAILDDPKTRAWFDKQPPADQADMQAVMVDRMAELSDDGDAHEPVNDMAEAIA